MMKTPDMIDIFMKHIDNKDVIDVLLKVIEESPEGSAEWLRDSNLIDRLVTYFDPSVDSEIHENVSLALERIIDITTSKDEKSPLLDQLEKDSTIEKILEYSFQAQEANRNSSSLLYGISVIIKLLSASGYVLEDDPVLSVYEVCIKFIDKILSFLEFGKSGALSVETTTGPLEPFGFVRMKIVQLILALLTSNNKAVIDLLVEKQVFKTILDLFFHFQWNNLLHTQVHLLVRSILEGRDVSLKRSLLIDGQLVQRMIENHESNLKEIAENKKVHRRGYLGFLIEIL